MPLPASNWGPTPRRLGRTLAWLVSIIVVCSACLDNSCEQITDRPVDYTDGTTNAARTFYESSTPDEEFLRFPAGRRIRMQHGLGQKPSSYTVSLSLRSDGKDEVPSSGNLSLLNTTDKYIQVENDTCTDLFVRVTAALDHAAMREPDAATASDATFDGNAVSDAALSDTAASDAVTSQSPSTDAGPSTTGADN